MADIRERFGVRGNIMFGNVDVIHGTPVGMILVSLDGPAEAVSKALGIPDGRGERDAARRPACERGGGERQ